MRCTSVARREFASIQTIRNRVELEKYRGVGHGVVVLVQKTEPWQLPRV
jgi:hypothetical protein